MKLRAFVIILVLVIYTIGTIAWALSIRDMKDLFLSFVPDVLAIYLAVYAFKHDGDGDRHMRKFIKQMHVADEAQRLKDRREREYERQQMTDIIQRSEDALGRLEAAFATDEEEIKNG